MKLKGKLVQGFKAASLIYLPKQMPLFKTYIPDIEHYYPGTINLLLEAPLHIYKPDIKTHPIEWTPGSSEVFGFVKVKIETIPIQVGMPLDAYIYIPYRSPHFSNPFYIEILAPKINLNSVEYCHVIVEREMKSMPIYIID